MQRKATRLETASVFSVVGSSVCITRSAQDVLEESFHKGTMRCRRSGGYLIITPHSISAAAALKVPCRPAMHTKRLTRPVHWSASPAADTRLGCTALIDSWLSSVPLYLFQSRPFTFAVLLIIYPDMLLVNTHKCAVLGSWQQMNSLQTLHEGSPSGQRTSWPEDPPKILLGLQSEAHGCLIQSFFLCGSMRHNIKPNRILMCSRRAKKAQPVAKERNFKESDTERLRGNWELKWTACVAALRISA